MLNALQNTKVKEKISVKGYEVKKREKDKVITLFKLPPQVDDKEITEYLSKYGTITGNIRCQKYTSPGLENIENGNVTIKIAQDKHQIGSIHWFGGNKVDAYYPGIKDAATGA